MFELTTEIMRRLTQIARISRGTVRTNPLVGSAILNRNKVLAEGIHETFGSDHAEINALKQLKNISPKGYEMAVTLEPCNHQGKTPPCVDRIIAEQFKKVSIGQRDINPCTNGQSIQKLKEANIQVQVIDDSLSAALLRPFQVNQTENRPYIILKWAASKQGFMGIKGRQIWLTNAFSKRLVHKWRSEIDAILVGVGTVLTDDPQLTNRYGFGSVTPKQPLRIILDPRNTIDQTADLHINSSGAETMIISNRTQASVELSTVMNKLYKQQEIGVIMVEGGAATLQQFIDHGLYDEIRLIQTNKDISINANEMPIKSPMLPNNVTLKQNFKLLSDDVSIYFRNLK